MEDTHVYHFCQGYSGSVDWAWFDICSGPDDCMEYINEQPGILAKILYIACTFTDAVDGAKHEVDAANNSGLFSLLCWCS